MSYMSELHAEMYPYTNIMDTCLPDTVYILVSYTESSDTYENLFGYFSLEEAEKAKKEAQDENSNSIFYDEYRRYLIDPIKIVDR